MGSPIAGYREEIAVRFYQLIYGETTIGRDEQSNARAIGIIREEMVKLSDAELDQIIATNPWSKDRNETLQGMSPRNILVEKAISAVFEAMVAKYTPAFETA